MEVEVEEEVTIMEEEVMTMEEEVDMEVCFSFFFFLLTQIIFT